jgi:hypothetical protein
MPLTKKELPLEVGDHVTLDHSVLLGDPRSIAIIPRLRGGIGGMVTEVFPQGQVAIEFCGSEYVFEHPDRDVSLYRRSQDSKRRRA